MPAHVIFLISFMVMLRFKGIVHPKMKITPWFTHSQAILGVYDFFFLSDEYNLS